MKPTKSVQDAVCSFPEEYGAKEIYWALWGMGVIIQETEIVDIRARNLRHQCRCPDDSGSCDACVKYYDME